MLAAMRFAYPTITQTRWNSTDEANPKVAIRYVESASPESYRSERQMRQHQYVNEGPVPKSTVYVGNLFFDVTAEDLRKQFENFGVVENALIVHDARGLSKGWVSRPIAPQPQARALD